MHSCGYRLTTTGITERRSGSRSPRRPSPAGRPRRRAWPPRAQAEAACGRPGKGRRTAPRDEHRRGGTRRCSGSPCRSRDKAAAPSCSHRRRTRGSADGRRRGPRAGSSVRRRGCAGGRGLHLRARPMIVATAETRSAMTVSGHPRRRVHQSTSAFRKSTGARESMGVGSNSRECVARCRLTREARAISDSRTACEAPAPGWTKAAAL